jgi:GxxExxY protein
MELVNVSQIEALCKSGQSNEAMKILAESFNVLASGQMKSADVPEKSKKKDNQLVVEFKSECVSDVEIRGWTGQVAAALLDPVRLGKLISNLASAIFMDLGTTFREGVYQTALVNLLREIGFVVKEESEIMIVYRGKKITSRRCDVLLSHESHPTFSALLELKQTDAAKYDIKKMMEKHSPQLYYYLEKFSCKLGFLVIFFPGSAFPPPDAPEPYRDPDRRAPFVSEPFLRE